jgi:hypothetical protein
MIDLAGRFRVRTTRLFIVDKIYSFVVEELTMTGVRCCCVLIAWAGLLHFAGADAAPPPKFEPLFNGRDFSGWHGMGFFDPRKLAEMSDTERAAKRQADMEDMLRHWTIEDGEIVNDGQGVFLTTDKKYGDIELLIEYRTVPKADSGIYLRTTPQLQVWDYTKEGGFWRHGADKGSGGLWNNSPGAPGKDPLVLADRPIGEWNKFRILQVGARTSVWLNGKMVVDHAIMENFWDPGRPLFSRGRIQLETHGREIRWRNLYVREIQSEEANKMLAEKGTHGFEAIFNGRDFTGWSGSLKNYEIEDGALFCNPQKGGTIYTQKEYADFAVRFEFMLPPGGNNGLAIRYPGSGDSAYQGMCELQVLDSESPKYADLDRRQYHGSAYGMVAAHRGYLRPTGTWNLQEVNVRGSTIRVELNGYPILDADLSGVTEFMGDRPHPGKDRKQGHFGFVGNKDPVKFRNIAIREL